ncbi:hypothetical protein BJV77DRAFT_207662 [Russula vinacea]|nr:hypothetical protein BJV77DRAFT_207662 [Russula vinacea]
MQPQPPPLAVRQLASHDVGIMQAKLLQVEMRMRETHKRLVEAEQAGDTAVMNNQRNIFTQQATAYKKARHYVAQVENAKQLVAAQAQGSSQPHDPVLNPGTSQHPTPAVSATPQATTPMNTHSTPRLATPRKPGMPVNQNPMLGMNASSPDINPNSGASTGPSPAANANAALLQAFNPTVTQTPPQVSLGGVSAHDPHVLGATPQHGHTHNNSLGKQPLQMPPGVTAAQMKQFIEQRGLAQGNQGSSVRMVLQERTRAGLEKGRANNGQGRLPGRGRILRGMRGRRYARRSQRPHQRATQWHQHGQKFCHLCLLGPQCQWRSYTTGSKRTSLW